MENQELQALKQQMQRMQDVLTPLQKQSLLSANTSTIVQKEYQSPAKQTTDEQEEKESDESSETSEPEISMKRTLTDATEGSTDSSTSKSIQAKKIKSFQQTSPRVNLLHERLSPKDFMLRLQTNLSVEEMNNQLKTTFLPLQTFRERFIIPLSAQAQVPDSKVIDLNEDYSSAINMVEFKEMYRLVFVNGCNVTRVGRKKNTPVVPDTSEKKAYRNFISNCWFILGETTNISTPLIYLTKRKS